MVVFRTHVTEAGVLRAGKLIWMERLHGAFRRIVAPGPRGLFVILVHRRHGESASVHRLDRGRVRSGIAGIPSGEVSGSEGIAVRPAGLVVRAADTARQGSVRYRTLTPYAVCGRLLCRRHAVLRPDYARGQAPLPNATFTLPDGSIVLLRLEVAATVADQNRGLMNVHSLDPDTGMLFAWSDTVLCSFWMKDTDIPLDIAFLGPDGTVHQIIHMPLNDPAAGDSIPLYTPGGPYQFAIEANAGYWSRYGIAAGARAAFHLGPVSLTDAPKTCYG